MNHTGNIVWKRENYFDVYVDILDSYRGRPVTFMEMGVNTGGAIDMWAAFFGLQLVYHGVDNFPKCAQLSRPPKVTVHIGSQTDRQFLERVAEKVRSSFPLVIPELPCLWSRMSIPQLPLAHR